MNTIVPISQTKAVWANIYGPLHPRDFFFGILKENIIQRELYIVAKLGDNLKSIGTRCLKKRDKNEILSIKNKKEMCFLNFSHS